jgi:hypothetical protein
MVMEFWAVPQTAVTDVTPTDIPTPRAPALSGETVKMALFPDEKTHGMFGTATPPLVTGVAPTMVVCPTRGLPGFAVIWTEATSEVTSVPLHPSNRERAASDVIKNWKPFLLIRWPWVMGVSAPSLISSPIQDRFFVSFPMFPSNGNLTKRALWNQKHTIPKSYPE